MAEAGKSGRRDIGVSVRIDDDHPDKLRADDERFDRLDVHDPQGLKWSKMDRVNRRRGDER
ncbi:hypothetical protein AU198_22040 [Mycobacterium sp. GA-1199]|nr:hypothetical protein AU198_22040 [Mycobacterium sp. GA-1199]UUO00896.1 hypothetical protein M4D79_19400 [Mycolicibacterium novocastrense]